MASKHARSFTEAIYGDRYYTTVPAYYSEFLPADRAWRREQMNELRKTNIRTILARDAAF